MRVSSVFVALACLAAAGFAPQAMAAEVKQTIKLHQQPPALVSVDLGTAGNSDGDMLALQAALEGSGGAKATLYGPPLTVGIPHGADKTEDRAGQIYVDFGGGNSIVVAGRSVYGGGEKEMPKGAPQLRAVIGGTGAYIGARGQVTTVRNADNSYDHVIELLD